MSGNLSQSNSGDNPSTAATRTAGDPLPIQPPQADVPAFGCIVLFRVQDGIFHGRVANLAGINVSASSQREMLGQIVARFKSAVATAIDSGTVPAWIDPPAVKHDGESKLFLPVHL